MSAKTGIEWTGATKRCSDCKQVKPRAAFFADRTRADGLSYRCRDCRNGAARSRYIKRGRPERSGPPPAQARDGDKKQARRRVNVLVRTQRLPHANTVACADCGHTGTDRRHEYDHRNGYGAAHHLDVEVVCSRCHRQRERVRGVQIGRRRHG